MEASWHHRIPLSVYLGADPSRGWTGEDRDVAAAWQQWTGLLHERCGHPLDEAMDPDNEWRRTGRGLLVPRWSGEVNHCFVCAATDAAVRAHRDTGRDGSAEVNMDGLVVSVRDRDREAAP